MLQKLLRCICASSQLTVQYIQPLLFPGNSWVRDPARYKAISHGLSYRALPLSTIEIITAAGLPLYSANTLTFQQTASDTDWACGTSGKYKDSSTITSNMEPGVLAPAQSFASFQLRCYTEWYLAYQYISEACRGFTNCSYQLVVQFVRTGINGSWMESF